MELIIEVLNNNEQVTINMLRRENEDEVITSLQKHIAAYLGLEVKEAIDTVMNVKPILKKRNQIKAEIKNCLRAIECANNTKMSLQETMKANELIEKTQCRIDALLWVLNEEVSFD